MLESVRRAVHAVLDSNPAALPAKQIAERMGVSLSLVYSWGDPSEYGADIPLGRLKQLTLITEDGRALAEFCAQVGYICIPTPKLGSLGSAEPGVIKAISEFSEFLKANADAMIDGRVNEAELDRIEKEGGEAQLAIARLVQFARRARKKGESGR